MHTLMLNNGSDVTPTTGLMGLVAAVGQAARGMVPGEIGELTQAVADSVRGRDRGANLYALSRARALTLGLWTSLQGHPCERDLRVALFRLYVALSAGPTPTSAVAPLPRAA